MAIDNVSKAAISPAEFQTANAAELVNTFPQSALYAQAFQPLYSSINPSGQYSFSPNPPPFTLNSSASLLLANPAEFLGALTSGADTLDSALGSAGDALASAEAKYTADLNNPDTDQKTLQQDLLAYQKAMTKFQMVSQLASQLESIKLSLAQDAIRNMKA